MVKALPFSEDADLRDAIFPPFSGSSTSPLAFFKKLESSDPTFPATVALQNSISIPTNS